jgi:hypothetical protein
MGTRIFYLTPTLEGMMGMAQSQIQKAIAYTKELHETSKDIHNCSKLATHYFCALDEYGNTTNEPVLFAKRIARICGWVG